MAAAENYDIFADLHGLPLVHTLEDAFHVMENSSLKYLAIGNHLIRKS